MEENKIKSKKRKRKGGCAVIFIFFAIIILVVAGISAVLLSILLNKGVSQKPQEKEGISLVLEDRSIESDMPVIVNGSVMLDVDFIKKYIDDTIFWESESEKLTVTTADKVIRMVNDELTYYVNNEPFELDLPVYTHNGYVYMPGSLGETLYSIDVEYNAQSDTVIVDYTHKDSTIGVMSGRTTVYSQADKKSDRLFKIDKNSDVKVYETQGDYTKIRTTDGRLGFVLTKHIGQIQQIQAIAAEEERQQKPSWTADNGKITMVWDQIFNVEQNSRESKRETIEGLDVISPTWFALENGQGDISNIADEDYVKWAHDNGYQVWALFSNSFDAEITHEALSNTDTREKIIKQILAFASIYNLDGINIDFESVASRTGEYYVQFIREITPYLKQQGIVVSVDMYVPKAWTSHYGMAQVGEVVDYVVIMAYDEHWGTSPESGSVASRGWVYEGMTAAQEMVDSSKIIMGIPFYTRLWKETQENGELTVSSSAYGMTGGKNILEENNVETQWIEDIGQYYGEYEKDGSTYKMWLEDERSLEVRLDTAVDLDVAGIAGWKRGLESDEAWGIINNKIKG